MVCTQHVIRWDVIRFIQFRFFLRHLHGYGEGETDFVTGVDLVISHPFMFAGFRLYLWYTKKNVPFKISNLSIVKSTSYAANDSNLKNFLPNLFLF